MFEKEIQEYERLLKVYHEKVIMRFSFLHKAGHPIVIITQESKSEYINALRQIRTERTDEHLVSFFFQSAINRMQREIDEKKKQSIIFPFFF